MDMTEDILRQLGSDIEGSVTALRGQLQKLRTGRANLGILDGVRVKYYGSLVPLNQVANMNVADARLLTVRPYERNIIPDIERAILASDVGIMPQNDGETIRLPVPPLNEERRRDLVRQSKKSGEEARIGVRNHRRDANEMLKELEKGKEISQDDLKRALDKVQAEADRGNTRIDEVLAAKEKEILDI